MDFQKMTKQQLKEYGETIGVKLNLKNKKDVLIEELNTVTDNTLTKKEIEDLENRLYWEESKRQSLEFEIEDKKDRTKWFIGYLVVMSIFILLLT